jgi:hypothetical protein
MALSDKAKWHAVIGAITVDRTFRDRLIAADASTRSAIIDDYSVAYGLDIAPTLRAEMVDKLFRPCVAEIQTMLNDQQNLQRVCPCWPCLSLVVGD